MQKILDYASAKTGFVGTRESPYPEFVIGTAPGIPLGVGWVYRTDACFTVATGSPDEVISAFGKTPLRTLDADVIHRLPVGAGWSVSTLVVRRYENSPIRRIVAIGQDGEASILFEGDEPSEALLASMQAAAAGKSLREIVAGIVAAETGHS